MLHVHIHQRGDNDSCTRQQHTQDTSRITTGARKACMLTIIIAFAGKLRIILIKGTHFTATIIQAARQIGNVEAGAAVIKQPMVDNFVFVDNDGERR